MDHRRVAWAQIGALAFIAALALALRLNDPLSQRSPSAEDPFTHLVFVKEHLARGYFADSAQIAAPLYPPGLHVLVGILAAWSGIPLEAWARFFAPALGVLGACGMYVLARRLAGEGAGLVAGTLYAVIPETIFRTTLFAPTAFDLAILPLFLLAAVEMAEGRWAWAPLAVLSGGILLFTHPWAVPLAALVCVVYVVLSLLPFDAPLAPEHRPRLAMAALAAALGALAFLVPQGEFTQSIFRDLLRAGPARMLRAAPYLAAGAAVLFGGAFLVRRAAPRVRLAASVAGAVALVAVAFVLASGDLPRFVDYPAQLGAPAIGLAALGLVLLPLHRTRLGTLGLAAVLATFPFTALDVFHHNFWPHRTVAYLAIGVALLGGAAAPALAEAASRVAVRLRRPRAAPAAAVACVVVLAAGAAAATPAPYEWYRLYDEDSYGALVRVAAYLERHPDARVVVAQWQPNVVLKALAPLHQVLYSEAAFERDGAREDLIDARAERGQRLLFLVDDHTRETAEEEGWDLAFLDPDRARVVVQGGDVRLYELR